MSGLQARRSILRSSTWGPPGTERSNEWSERHPVRVVGRVAPLPRGADRVEDRPVALAEVERRAAVLFAQCGGRCLGQAEVERPVVDDAGLAHVQHVDVVGLQAALPCRTGGTSRGPLGRDWRLHPDEGARSVTAAQCTCGRPGRAPRR